MTAKTIRTAAVLRLRQRLAFAATALFILISRSRFPLEAQATEPSQSPHEAAVLDRIFANWKARHDRVHTLHFTWDCRTTCKKGAWDPSSNLGDRLDRDQEFDQFGAQLWIEGDNHLCFVATPTFKVPQAQVADTGRIVRRHVSVDQTTCSLFVDPVYETGAPTRVVFAPHGSIHRISVAQLPEVRPLVWAFRPRQLPLPWMREQCHLVAEDVGADNGRSVKLKRIVEPSAVNARRREFLCWISPARDDVVVRETVESQNRIDVSIRYKKDQTSGWIPWEWSEEIDGETLIECKVTRYAVNEKIDPAVFSQQFPAGTLVDDRLHAVRGAFLHYLVQPDGSKREISPMEYGKLILRPVKAKKSEAKNAGPPAK
jgi:hypothetical protein